MFFLRSFLFLSAVSLLFCGISVFGQQPASTPDEPIRIETNLMQTELMVFDKQGNFVSGLQSEQLELKVDNKTQPVSFLEQVKAGSATEEAQRAKVFGSAQPAEVKTASPAVERGRTVIFFVDDLHLSLTSLAITREMITRFIDNEMTPKDQVIIACTSGDIGYLQQFTNDKMMLKAAVGKLTHHSYNVREMTREATPMSEYAALTIERNDDPKVALYYIEQCLLSAPPNYKRDACEVEVKNRARLVLQQAASVVVGTYGSFENLLNLASQMPGRKLSFFVSDGFLADGGPRSMDTSSRLNKIINKARSNGVVVYTIDARGLVSQGHDATTSGPMDMNGRLANMQMREIAASQDALNAIARDTGGRALRNQNYFDAWVSKVLDETSDYYLLAWYLEDAQKSGDDLRSIKVQVIGHPEYEVRFPKGFLKNANTQLAAGNAKKPGAPKSPQEEIRDALYSVRPRREIPVSLSAVYLDTPDNGMVLTTSVQVENESLAYEGKDDKRTAAVDLVGIMLDDKGKKAGGFQTRINIDSLSEDKLSKASSDTIYNYRLPLKPGLYQVRIAVRDGKAGTIGTAGQWIEIPDLNSKKIMLSSLLVGVEDVGENNSSGVQFSVDHRFDRNTRLRYIAFIYNAPNKNIDPDLNIQAQIIKAGQVVATGPLRKIAVNKQDPARIPFGDEISLGAVPPGQYMLRLKVTDRAGKTETVQQTEITVR